MKQVFPRCKTTGAQIYVSADGYVTPCCWIGSANVSQELKAFFSEDYENLSLKHQNLDQILNNNTWKKIEESWKTDKPFALCLRYCSKPIQKDRKGTNLQERIRL